jgi:hypothetical protein
MNHHAAPARQSGDALQQFARATDGEARREAVAHAPAGAPVPLLKQRQRLAYRVLRLLAQPRRHLLALVHHALAHGGAEARLLHDAEDLFGVPDRLHRQRAGRAAANHLGDAEARRGAQGVRVVRGLHGPDAPLEPVEKL